MILDLIILAILLVWAAFGLGRGAIREMIGALAILLGVFLATHAMDQAGRLLAISLPISDRMRPFAGFTVVFLVVVAFGAVVGSALERTLKTVHLGWLNRLAGAVIGLFKAAVVISLVLLLLGRLGQPPPTIRTESALYQPIHDIAPKTYDLLRFGLPGAKSFYEKLRDASARQTDTLLDQIERRATPTLAPDPPPVYPGPRDQRRMEPRTPVPPPNPSPKPSAR